uniref:Uncharacterized protein n=1 Tax=Ascaris lumbricoides TaxID=6252 RepID=A0A9J2PQ31_ASCLU
MAMASRDIAVQALLGWLVLAATTDAQTKDASWRNVRSNDTHHSYSMSLDWNTTNGVRRLSQQAQTRTLPMEIYSQKWPLGVTPSNC